MARGRSRRDIWQISTPQGLGSQLTTRPIPLFHILSPGTASFRVSLENPLTPVTLRPDEKPQNTLRRSPTRKRREGTGVEA